MSRELVVAGQIGVVVATRNRCPELSRTLRRLTRLPERPAVVVVDNASTDDTATMVGTEFPAVRLIRAHRNLGAAARNIGVAALNCRYIAFSDDDSWWQPGALALAAHAFDTAPGLGLIAARTLVGTDLVPDPVNAKLAAGRRAGATVLGFLGCAAVVRRAAFQAVGGFHPLLFFVGEERLLAYDLAAAGWNLEYRPDVVAVHRPSTRRPTASWRDRLERRNEVLTAWLRRPLPLALSRTARLVADSRHDLVARSALAGALYRLPAALWHRRRLPAVVEKTARMLERQDDPVTSTHHADRWPPMAAPPVTDPTR